MGFKLASPPSPVTLRLAREKFVAACVKHAFSDSVEGTFGEFEKGFFKVCSMRVVDIFQPEELQLLMVGQADYDWDQFKQVGAEGGYFSCGRNARGIRLMRPVDFLFQNTVYHGGYRADHPNIVTFWQVFEQLTEEEKQKFYREWKLALSAAAVQLPGSSTVLVPFLQGS